MNYAAIVFRKFYSNKQTSQKVPLLGRAPMTAIYCYTENAILKPVTDEMADKFKLLPRHIIKDSVFSFVLFVHFLETNDQKLKSIFEKLASFR